MAITLEIGGVNKTAYLNEKSFSYTDELNARNTCDFTLDTAPGAYRPIEGQSVEVTDGGTTHFAGTIHSVTEGEVPGPSGVQTYKVSCVDHNEIADRRRVAAEYTSMDATEIVDDLVTNYLAADGVTYSLPGAGSGGPLIERIIFNYCTAAEALTELAELVGFYWNIGYDKVLTFADRTAAAAPFDITDSSANYVAGTLSIKSTRSQYRNVQYLRAGYDLTDPRTESFKGDGTNKTFTLSYPVGATPSSVTVNAVSKTIGIRGVDTGKDWYYQRGDRTITQDDGAAALTSSQTLAVTFQGQFPIYVKAQDDGEIAARIAIEGGSGIYEEIETDQNINDGQLAIDKAMAKLRRYGVIPRVATYDTDSAGLRAGQLQLINRTNFNVNDYYLIQRISGKILTKSTLRYSVEAVSGEALGGWQDFFRRLAKAGETFVIRDNEVFQLLVSFDEQIEFSDTLDQAVSGAGAETRVGFATVGYSEVG